MGCNENYEGELMYTIDQIMNMTPEEFAKNWNNGKIQDASLTLLGYREPSEEDEFDL
jgi:hypothetical protein